MSLYDLNCAQGHRRNAKKGEHNDVGVRITFQRAAFRFLARREQLETLLNVRKGSDVDSTFTAGRSGTQKSGPK